MTSHFANSQYAPVPSPLNDSLHQLGLAGLGACVAAERETRWMIQTLFEQGQRLETALLDNLAQRTMIAGRWVDAVDRTTMTWWDQVEQVSRLQFERLLHQYGLATHDDLRALARKLDDVNLRIVDLSEALEKTA